MTGPELPPDPASSAPADPAAIDPRRATLLGIVLFLFIPVVLFLFVAHPRPVAASLGAGLLLMVGHRFLARPYMLATRPHKCVWCNRFFTAGGSGARAPQRAVELAQGGALPPLELLACAAHVAPTRRFFAFVDRCRQPLRFGIGLPLGLLLGSLIAFSAGVGASFLAKTTETRYQLTTRDTAFVPLPQVDSASTTKIGPVPELRLNVGVAL